MLGVVQLFCYAFIAEGFNRSEHEDIVWRNEQMEFNKANLLSWSPMLNLNLQVDIFN